MESQSLFNQRIDAVAAGTYLLLLVAFVARSIREWFRLLSGRRPSDLREEPAVWLEAPVPPQAATPRLARGFSFAMTLFRELTGQASVDRGLASSANAASPTGQRVTVDLLGGARAVMRRANRSRLDQHLDAQYRGIRRCC
jgi:hypothetical protein